jgi:hypothetical protein
MLIATPDEILQEGLEIGGFNRQQQQRVKRDTNLRRFRAMYGSNPIVYAQIIEDLQTTHIEKARVKQKDISVKKFLIAMNFLKCYQSEEVRCGKFDVSEKTARKWGWFFSKKVQALKEQKIVWPESWNDGHPLLHDDDTPIFIVSVDGVHCRVNEPIHPTLSKNPKYYSHKHKQAALTYELAISVYENKLVHLKGPKPAATHDITVYRKKLKGKIPAGKRAICDNGYHGEPNTISTPSSRDPQELRRFKSWARARHESFNGRIKNFKCLAERFRHGKHKHQICFEAVCVIVQYQFENGSPLFDI